MTIPEAKSPQVLNIDTDASFTSVISGPNLTSKLRASLIVINF